MLKVSVLLVSVCLPSLFGDFRWFWSFLLHFLSSDGQLLCAQVLDDKKTHKSGLNNEKVQTKNIFIKEKALKHKYIIEFFYYY